MSLKLQEIHGLIPISKIKPNIQNTRVTQICGSMKGKEMLNVAESSQMQKEDKVTAKAAKENKKRVTEIFHYK